MFHKVEEMLSLLDCWHSTIHCQWSSVDCSYDGTWSPCS